MKHFDNKVVQFSTLDPTVEQNVLDKAFALMSFRSHHQGNTVKIVMSEPGPVTMKFIQNFTRLLKTKHEWL